MKLDVTRLNYEQIQGIVADLRGEIRQFSRVGSRVMLDVTVA